MRKTLCIIAGIIGIILIIKSMPTLIAGVLLFATGVVIVIGSILFWTETI